MKLRLPLALMLIYLAGCASAPRPKAPDAPVERVQGAGARAAWRAANLVGMPYRFGGASPVDGFDCSGLVHFSYREAGVALPRDTSAQRLAARPVRLAELEPGDLIFFNLEGKRNSHVGIYTGSGQFVHAPSTGRDVRLDRLDTPYWKKQLSETRRP
jgi:cell wall-associated NlpC family hydrolase